MNWQESRKNEIDKLFSLIEVKFNITKERLISKSRKKEDVAARMAFMNILFEIFESDKKMTHGDITDLINRSRMTFIHHRSGHLNSHKRYKAYREEYDNIKKEYTKSLE